MNSATLPVWPHAESPWHEGERALQRRAGSHDALAAAGPRIIRAEMPAQHREFFARLPFIVLGAADTDGQPWATLLAGAPGFVNTPSATQLTVAARPAATDPAGAGLQPGAAVAVLGIELATRRRNRANGRVAAVAETGFEIDVAQSFGNCPQYILPRELSGTDGLRHAGTAAAETTAAVQGRAAAIVAGADTFFIASQAVSGVAGGRHSAGADVSHRGGPAGFVKVEAEGGRLVWPDFAGNRFFNTLGNLTLDPRAGLVFADFDTGDLVQLAGRAHVVWDGPALAAFPEAERLLVFEVQRCIWRPGAWPLRGRVIEVEGR